MNTRQTSERYQQQGWERPRDEYGRFETEYDERRRASDRDYERMGSTRRYELEDDRTRNWDRSRYDDYGRQESRSDWQDRGEGENRSYGAREPQGWGRSRDDYGRFAQESRGGAGGYSSRYGSNYGNYAGSRYGEGRYGESEDRSYTGLESGYGMGGSNLGSSLGSYGSGSRSGGYERLNYGSNQPYGQGERGQFAGKGPKGYKRSDERIQEDVCEALARESEVDATEIEVKVSNGEVTLSGAVSDRESKRRAEDVAERCSGVQDVKNDIRVQRANGSEEGSQQNRTKAANAGGKQEARTH